MPPPNHFVTPPKNSGFTLIELLLVIIIVGVVMTFVSLNIGAKPSSAKQAASQLQNLLELARDDAILKGQILGWKMTAQNYGFYRYKNKVWQPITADKLLRNYNLQPDLNYKLLLDNSKIKINAESLPQITFLPDGSSNDFSLFIQPIDHSETYQIFTQQGKIKTQLVIKK